MALQQLKPMFRTWDILGTIRFYVDILGFQWSGTSEEPSWASLQRDDLVIMLSEPNAHEGDTKPCFTGSLYFTCDEVDVFWQSVKNRLSVCYPIEDFDYGMREFGIYDNNGYLLQCGMPLATVPGSQ